MGSAHERVREITRHAQLGAQIVCSDGDHVDARKGGDVGDISHAERALNQNLDGDELVDGLEQLGGMVAHEFEGVLDGARLGRIELTDAVLNSFEDALDAIAHHLLAPSEKPIDGAFTPILQRLNDIASTGRTQSAVSDELRAALPPDIARALSEYDLQHAREAIHEGARLFVVAAGFDLETFDRGFRQLTKLLGESGEVIATVPGKPATAEEINFRLLYAAELVTGETLRQASSLAHLPSRCAWLRLLFRIVNTRFAVERRWRTPSGLLSCSRCFCVSPTLVCSLAGVSAIF